MGSAKIALLVLEISMSTDVLSMSSLLPGSDLASYIRTVNALPILSAEQEKELATRFYEDEDLDAARELVLYHLRFVVHLAYGYRGYGLPEADIIQEGNVGLMKAVKRFNPNVGVRLVTFAVHWIKAEIHEYVMRNWRIVKVATTRAQRKLFFNLRSKRKSLQSLTSEEIHAIATDLGVKPKHVRQMEGRLDARDVAFDGLTDEDEATWTPAAVLGDDSQNPERVVMEEDWSNHVQAKLRAALKALDTRSRDIIKARWLDDSKATLQDLGEKYGISGERVRQIEQNAMKEIQQMLEAA